MGISYIGMSYNILYHVLSLYVHTAAVPIKMPCPRSPLEEMSSKSMARNMLDGTEDLIATEGLVLVKRGSRVCDLSTKKRRFWEEMLKNWNMNMI